MQNNDPDNTHSLETAAEQSPAGVPPEGKRGIRPYRGATVAAIFLAMTVLSSGDLIEIIPVFAPFVAGPLFPFVHETHDILAAMLALYVGHKFTPALGTRVMVYFLVLHLPYAYLTFPAELPELVRIAVTGAAAFLGIYIVWLRKRAEDRLRLQATALDAAANAIFITDRQGVIEWVNPAFTRITGHSAEEAIGQTARILKSGKRTGAFYKTLWDTILAGELWHAEMVNRTRDGGLFHVQQTITPLREPNGEIGHFVAIQQDITERVQAEAALRESEERYRTLVETAPDSIVAVSLDGTLVSLNRAFETLTGWPPEEWLGKPIAPFIHPDDLSAARELFQHILQGETRPPLEWRIRHRSGDYTTVELTAAPRLEHGQVVGLLGIARDITERKQREREVGAIVTVSAALRTATTRAEMLPVILDQLLNLLRADGVLLAMRDPATGETTIELGRGPAGASFTGVRLPPGEGITGHVIATSQPYLNKEVQSDPRFARPDLLPPPDIHAVACVPLIVQGQSIGALCLLHARDIAANEIRLLTGIADIAANAIHRATLYEQTEERLQHLSALRAVDIAILSSLDLRVTLNILLDQSTTHLHVDAADVLLFNRHTQTLDYAAGHGFRGGGITRSHLRLGEGQAGRAALERRTIYILNLAEETTSVRSGLLANETFVAHYATPLIAKGELKGVLEVFHRASLAADPEWLEFLEALAGQAAIAIDNANLFDGLQRSNMELALAYEATIDGWSRALDLRDKETEGHTQRVTEMTEWLAQAMDIGEAELVHLRRGALLHDIGKMGVPDGILLKPGPLTDDEWKVVRRHPQLAYDLLSPINYLRPALDIPYCHHEKWDGTGYPRGLKGEQIPLAARVFAVVDVWDALRSDRPYRKGWPKEKVIEHIKAGSGTHFDPKAVEAFLREMNERPEAYSGAG